MASKEYYCKSCGNNNHGWCPFLQSNGLKDVTSCNLKTPAGVKAEVCGETMQKFKCSRDTSAKSFEINGNAKKTAPSSNNVFVKEEEKKINKEGYKVYGAREMFFFIQQQLIGMSKDKDLDKHTLDTMKQIMVGLEKKLLIDEKCHGICTDYLMEQDTVKNSKMISRLWLNEVGEYKAPTKED